MTTEVVAELAVTDVQGLCLCAEKLKNTINGNNLKLFLDDFWKTTFELRQSLKNICRSSQQIIELSLFLFPFPHFCTCNIFFL